MVFLTQIDRLHRIQTNAARVITLTKKSCHITPILKELHWLLVSRSTCIICIKYKFQLLVYKLLTNNAPAYIDDPTHIVRPEFVWHKLWSCNSSFLNEPTSNHSWGDRSFSHASPRLWNICACTKKLICFFKGFRYFFKMSTDLH